MPPQWISGQSPTLYFYERLQVAFDHFNRTLFDGSLNQCLMTVRSSNRHHGYHHAHRFIAPDGEMIGELGLHPGYFTIQPIESAMATLVHEMVHVWQHQHGNLSCLSPSTVPGKKDSATTVQAAQRVHGRKKMRIFIVAPARRH